jgi:hypothetical protein
MNNEKLDFLKNTFIAELKKIAPDTPAVFGKMNLQQMVEHMSDSFQIANGKDKYPLMTPIDRLQSMKDFLMSEKDFRPNTKNALLPDEPAPCRLASIELAFNELRREVDDFVTYFETKPGETTTNPFFGHLNYEEWVQILYKHALHHLRQFGVDIVN